MPWDVEFDDAFEAEFSAFAEDVQDALLAVGKLLAEYGPQLGAAACGYAERLGLSQYEGTAVRRGWWCLACRLSRSIPGVTRFSLLPRTSRAAARSGFINDSLQRRTRDLMITCHARKRRSSKINGYHAER